MQLVENAKKEIERQQQGFVRLQREVATFKSKLQLVYKQHLELISSIPVDENIVEAAMKKSAPQPEPQPQPEQPSLRSLSTSCRLPSSRWTSMRSRCRWTPR